MAFVRFPAAKVSWSAAPATFASSDAVERGFCRDCGTPLTYRKVGGPNVSLTLNSLDDPSAVTPEFSVAHGQKAPGLDDLDGLEVVEPDGPGAPTIVSRQHPDG